MTMRNNPLDELIVCNIEISNPASSDVSFDSILLIVEAPGVSGSKTMTKTMAISKADELIDYGYTTEDAAYIAANVAFSQSPSPSELYICQRAVTSASDVEPKEYEDITLTLARAAMECGFYGFSITSFNAVSADVNSAIEWCEANEKLMAVEYTKYDEFPVTNTSYARSFCLFAGLADGYEVDAQPEVNKYANLANMAKCFGYQPGSETWHLKELSGIVPSALSTEQKNDLDSKNVTSFRRYVNSNVTFGGKVLAGEWIDVIRFRDWLKAEIQKNVFNAMKANPKVPFTDNGIGLVKNAMNKALLDGEAYGGIAPTEYDENGTAIPGYTVTVPKASSLTESQRKSRVLPNCKWTARLAGAIHLTEISGHLTF